MWNGKRVVSEEWVRSSVTPAVKSGSSTSYGFKWWLYQNPADTSRLVWGGSGFGGQFPMLFPNLTSSWSSTPGISSPDSRAFRSA